MQFFTVLAMATAAMAHVKQSTSCTESTSIYHTFSLGGGYNATVTASALPSTSTAAVVPITNTTTTSAPQQHSTVYATEVVTLTECPSTVTNCPARTSTIVHSSATSSVITKTVIPVPVHPTTSTAAVVPSNTAPVHDTSSTTTITATSTQTTVATVTGTLPNKGSTSSLTQTITLSRPDTCVASTVTATVTLPPVTVTVQPSTSTGAVVPPVNTKSEVAPPKPSGSSSVHYPTGHVTIVPVPSGTAPGAGYPSGTGAAGFPSSSPITPVIGAAPKIGSSAFGLVAAIAAVAMLV